MNLNPETAYAAPFCRLADIRTGCVLCVSLDQAGVDNYVEETFDWN